MNTNKETAIAFVAGKAAKAGNFYTDGITATSYNTMIANKVNGVILIADQYKAANWYGSIYGRTPTTERQIAYIVRAAKGNGTPIYRVPNIIANSRAAHEENYKHLSSIADALRKKAQRARTESNKSLYASMMTEAEVDANEYYKNFLFI